MPFVKLHLSSNVSKSSKKKIMMAIRLSLVEILGIHKEHGHVVCYESALESRECHENRDKNFVFIEILMFSGRTDEKKEKLYKNITEIINNNINVNINDIIINIIESDRKNWAGRGGIPVSKLNLGY